MGKFLKELFQDIDGAYSSKRTAFFIFIGLFVTLTVGIYFKMADEHTLNFLQGALDKVTDIIKWLGGFIVTERVQLFGKKTGDSPSVNAN